MKEVPSRKEKYQSPARATLTGILDLFKRSADQVSLEGMPSLEGKKILVTGASSGLGLATSMELARRGAHVIMAVRSGIPEKGELVKRKSGSEKVDMIPLDLANISSLPAFALALKQGFGMPDVIICNAAMVAKQGRPVKEGLDEMFVVNYFAKFLLMNELIKGDPWRQSGTHIPRIIFVASESHRNPEHIDWEGFGTYKPYGIKDSVAMYGYYKLLLLTMANELSRRLNSGPAVRCSVFALCPGPVNSNIAREAPRVFQPLLKLVFGIFFRSPKKACRPVIYLAASGAMEGRTGEYMFLMQRKDMDEKAMDPEKGRRLWQLSEELSINIHMRE
ncbi:MAG: SDR family NAD(P)-dependent oxidoreductase [Bacteroidia bacterium]|nr:MAG: SDR family NAD(P)-dependent oxidoreductase [Bacteroidia bacterium]